MNATLVSHQTANDTHQDTVRPIPAENLPPDAGPVDPGMELVLPVGRMDDRHAVPRQVTGPNKGRIAVQHRRTGHDEMVDQSTVKKPVERMVPHRLGIEAAIDERKSAVAQPPGESRDPEVLGPVGVDEVEAPRSQKPPQPQRIPERGWNVFRFQK